MNEFMAVWNAIGALLLITVVLIAIFLLIWGIFVGIPLLFALIFEVGMNRIPDHFLFHSLGRPSNCDRCKKMEERRRRHREHV
jgi:hypothetical protein